MLIFKFHASNVSFIYLSHLASPLQFSTVFSTVIIAVIFKLVLVLFSNIIEVIFIVIINWYYHSINMNIFPKVLWMEMSFFNQQVTTFKVLNVFFFYFYLFILGLFSNYDICKLKRKHPSQCRCFHFITPLVVSIK